MPSTINADNGVSSGSAGLKSTADASGVLALQTNGTTAVSISTAQVVSYTNQPVYSGGTANGVAYLNGSKVLTTGSALVFDGTNLGVGAAPTTSWPAGRPVIEINGTTTGNLAFNGNNTNGYQIWNNSYYNGSVSVYKYNGYATNFGAGGNGSFFWNLAASGTAGNAITFTQAMTLDASGNLGIGTTTTDPYSLGSGGKTLAMNCTTAGTGTLISMASGGSARGYFYANDTEFRMSAYTAIPIIFKTSDTERARIDSSGNLLVGTTSAGDGKVRISASANAFNLLKIDDTGSTGGNFVQFLNSSGAQAGSINHNGTTSVNYGSGSDYRLKDITGPVTNAADFINSLKPKVGTWKADGSKFVGFLAHEFAEVCPQAVVGEKDGVDADGNPIYQSMEASSSEVIANMVSLLQEQQALITQLQADVAALKGA